MSRHRELVCNAVPGLGKTPPERPWRGFFGLLSFGIAVLVRIDRLYPLGAVAIDRDSFQTEFPSLHIGGGDFLHRAFFGHVDRLAYRTGDKRLHRGHHLQMGKIMDMPLALPGLESTIENRQVLVAQLFGGLDRLVGIDRVAYFLDLFGTIAQTL